MIETPRLFLRDMTDEDFSALYAVLADSDIMQHYPYSFDEKRVRNWIRRNQERYRVYSFGLWAVCLRDSGEMIGDCGLTMQDINGFIRPEIGYHLRADRQHHGYATEAAAAVRDWAFENTPFQHLFSYMHEANTPSAAVARRIGMTLVERYEDPTDGNISVYGLQKKKG